VVAKTSSGVDLRILQGDCDLFRQFEVGGVPLGDTSEADKAHLRQLRRKLKELADQAAEISDSFTFSGDVSQWNVHGTVPPDLCCCAYPESAGNKAYALQIALVVSSRGAELCFCLGSGTGQGAGREASFSL
jgi:hypothetical protein